MPLANITVDGPAIRFSIAGVPGGPTFAGALSADGATIQGDFTQGPGKLTFSLKRNTTGKPTIVAAPRPQEPKPPYPYVTDEVTIQNTAAGVQLAGTLTTPRRRGRVSGRDPHHGIRTAGSERIHRRTQAVPRPGRLPDAPGHRRAAARRPRRRRLDGQPGGRHERGHRRRRAGRGRVPEVVPLDQQVAHRPDWPQRRRDDCAHGRRCGRRTWRSRSCSRAQGSPASRFSTSRRRRSRSRRVRARNRSPRRGRSRSAFMVC